MFNAWRDRSTLGGMAAGLEDRFRMMLRRQDTVSAVCGRSIFSSSLFSNMGRISMEDFLAQQQTNVEAPMEEEEAPLFLGTGYLQCKADRRSQAKVIINNFTTGSNITNIGTQHFIGSLDSPLNTNTKKTFLATRHNTSNNCKQNISLSFDPKTLTCISCATKHSIMNTYNNTSTQPLTIMLSDQNQNSSLSGF
jgi:hypothetical protein